MSRKIIIDTDPGVDDAAAILLALASPEISVEAITTVYGNGNIEQCTRNALTLLDIANRNDIPVYAGVNKPLIRDVRYGTYIHGSNAFGGVEFDPPSRDQQPMHAAWAIIDHIKKNPGEITLVALGPQTNVALALSLEPCIADLVEEIVIMGGAVFTYGNATPLASANLWYDPEAANIVYRSAATVVQAGLDVCRDVTFSRDQFQQIKNAGLTVTELLAKITPFLAERYQKTSKSFTTNDYMAYNDVPAIAYLINPGLFDIQEYFVQISTHDEMTRGQTVADITGHLGYPPNTKILFNVDSTALKEMFIHRLINYAA
jgi:inosine-uridine nucleoside N-ribohydrolase